MRRALTTVLTVGLLLITVPAQAHDVAPWKLKWGSERWEDCRLNLNGGALNKREARRTIVCANDHWAVPGGVRFALFVAGNESGLSETAGIGDGDCCKGIFQIHYGNWSSWRSELLAKSSMKVARSYYDGRANILTAMHKVAHGSWAPWCGYTSYC